MGKSTSRSHTHAADAALAPPVDAALAPPVDAAAALADNPCHRTPRDRKNSVVAARAPTVDAARSHAVDAALAPPVDAALRLPRIQMNVKRTSVQFVGTLGKDDATQLRQLLERAGINYGVRNVTLEQKNDKYVVSYPVYLAPGTKRTSQEWVRCLEWVRREVVDCFGLPLSCWASNIKGVFRS